MSIINKVLKDLDKRGQEPFDREDGGSAVERAKPKAKRPWIILAVAIVGVVFGIIFWPADDEQSMTVYEAEPVSQSESTINAGEANSDAEVASGKESSKAQTENTSATRDGSREVINETVSLRDSSRSEKVDETKELSEPRADDKTQQPEPESAEESQSSQSSATESKSVFVKKSVELTAEEIAQQNIEKAEKAQQQGRLTQAEEHWRQALAVTPKNKRVRKQLAALQYGRNKVTDALATLEAGFQLDKTDTDFRMLSARILEREARPSAALNVLLKHWPAAEENLDYSQKVALLAQDIGNYDVAETAYTRLIEAQPNEGRWYVGKALVQEEQGDASALSSYQQALERVSHEPTRQFIEQKIATLSAEKNSVGKP